MAKEDKVCDNEVKQILVENDFRVELNNENKTLGAKIREATLQKIPYMIIIGEKEIGTEYYSVRTREGKNLGRVNLYEFIKKIKEEIEKKL